jgi:hydroxymethylglutaryl-CoA lyase
MRFAGMLPDVVDRFAGLTTSTAVTGSPLLPEVLCWLDCRVWNVYDGGDHSIFVGEVLAVDTSGADTPLLYHNRLWRRSESLAVPTLPPRAEIVEVGPRDGLQSETRLIPTAEKTALIDALVDAGVTHIQVASFVSPQRVPQMADAEEVCRRITRRAGVLYSGLVLNMRGLERAYAAGLDQVDLSLSASETHSRHNAGRTVDEALAELGAMVEQARAWGLRVRAGIQCAFGCAYEGAVAPQRVVGLARRILAMGVDELALADSTGTANPQQVRRIVQELLPLARATPLVLHLHDTRGMGLANLLAALKSGVYRFDTAFGGLGGCPFIPGASGNIATEDTVFMLHEMGVPTGIDIARIAECSQHMEQVLGRQLPGKMARMLALGKGSAGFTVDSGVRREA